LEQDFPITSALWESRGMVYQNIKSYGPSAELDNARRRSADESANPNTVRPFYATTVGRLVDESLLDRLRSNCCGLSNTSSQFQTKNLHVNCPFALSGFAI